MGEMIVAHDISHGLKANQQIRADGLRRRDTHRPDATMKFLHSTAPGDVDRLILVAEKPDGKRVVDLTVPPPVS
jgi:hypothetical protein